MQSQAPSTPDRVAQFISDIYVTLPWAIATTRALRHKACN
jgi:hypothetical protein